MGCRRWSVTIPIVNHFLFTALSAIWLLLVIGNCSCQSQRPPTAIIAARHANEPPAGSDASPNAGKIRDLIEKLAISNEVASPDPIYTPLPGTPQSDPRFIAMRTGKELEKYGMEAFPYLLASFGDQRQSVAFRRVLPSTVGDACFCIIMWQIIPLLPNYRGSFFRTGADGKMHAHPVRSKHLFEPETLNDWLAARPNRSLPQLQLEAIEWVLAEEEKIGFRTPREEATYIAPLREERDKIRKEIAGGE
jgi:hypothetical protein